MIFSVAEIFFFRIVVGFSRVTLAKDRWAWIHGLFLGVVAGHCAMADMETSLRILVAAEVTSYTLGRGINKKKAMIVLGTLIAGFLPWDIILKFVAPLGIVVALNLDLRIGVVVIAAFWPALCKLLPVAEFQEAYGALEGIFGDQKDEFKQRTLFLAALAVHIQLSLGSIGVYYLRQSQVRKNALIVGANQISARTFAKKYTWPFLWSVAVPYLVQRVIVEACYELTFQRYSFAAGSALRLNTALRTGSGRRLAAFAGKTTSKAATTPSLLTLDAYGTAVEASAKRVYDLVSRKLFALPKIALLPSLAGSNPMVFLWTLPGCVLVDAVKAHFMAMLTLTVERKKKQATAAASFRTRVEASDIGSAEALAATPGAASFARDRWRSLQQNIEGPSYERLALDTARRYLRWLYWSDFLTPAIEVALAAMLEHGMIDSSDIWVLARAIEDTLDLLLTKSRAEAELASLKTDVDRLSQLTAHLTAVDDRGHKFQTTNVTCSSSGGSGLVIDSLSYERGHTRAAGSVLVYPGDRLALVGPNGAGKSTFFGILLAACAGTSLPEGLANAKGTIKIGSTSTLYPGHMAHVPQRPYCPTASNAGDWVTAFAGMDNDAVFQTASDVLVDLEFFHGSETREAAVHRIRTWLQGTAEDDVCGGLSGGQAVKLELTRQIFLPVRLGATCPDVLLLDETFAPLDPDSKKLVQTYLVTACPSSATIVIYHAGGENQDCLTGDYFTGALELALSGDGYVLRRVSHC